MRDKGLTTSFPKATDCQLAPALLVKSSVTVIYIKKWPSVLVVLGSNVLFAYLGLGGQQLRLVANNHRELNGSLVRLELASQQLDES